MGFLTGSRRSAEPAGEERAKFRAPKQHAYIGSYADVVVDGVSAAQSVAIRSTVDLIASLGSELPVHAYEGPRGVRNRTATVPDWIEDPGGDGLGREDWAYRLLWSWLITGNAFGNVVDRRDRTLITVDLFSPDDVTATVMDGAPQFHVNGVFAGSSLQHWRVNPQAGHLLGMSPIEHHATTIGTSLATSRFGRQWFKDGAHPSGLLYNELTDINAEQAEVAKKRIMDTRGGSEPMVFGKGWKWENVQITPEESQFLQTQGMSEAQCARIYGPGFAEILGYESGGKSMTYSNIVDRRQDLLVFSMNRWLRRYERVLNAFTPEGMWVELNRDALLEATTLQRYQAHQIALQWRPINEIREIEHLDPIDGGDIITSAPPAPTAQGGQ